MIISYVLKAPIRLYQGLISPFLAPRCRYLPTCSAYALEAMEKHGVIRGGSLAVLRFLNCHPWARRHRHDPVPEEFAWRDMVGYKRRRNGKNQTRKI